MSWIRTAPPARDDRLRARAKRLGQLMATARPRASVVGGSTSGAVVAKRRYVRSKSLLAAVRQLPCQVTGAVGQTEPAHSNWPQHGKAGRIKADDNRVAAIRADLHRELDQGSRWSAEERQRVWWQAHQRTVRALLDQGAWPARVPVPQIEEFWQP